MVSKSTDIDLTTLSVRVYQMLLRAYPVKFQQEYGSQMAQVFQDCCLRAVRQDGTNGMIKLWAVTLLDFIQSVISEHAHKEVQMKKEINPEDIRRAGWALIWGAVTFAFGMLSQFIGGSDFWGIGTALVILLSQPLLVIGLLGLRNRYGDNVGTFGKNILLTGAILGPLTTLIAFFGGVAHFFAEDSGWILLYIGLAALLACLALFGIVAIYKKPLPRWNVVPILAGAWYPVLSLFWFAPLLSPMAWGSRVNIPDNLSIVLLTIQSIALAALGYILKSDLPQETVAPA
jgi:hypothetical protein